MVTVFLHCTTGEKDQLIAELWELDTTGIVERDEPGGRSILEAYFDTPEQAVAAAARFPAFSPVRKVHEEVDYVQLFQQQWEPVAVGRRFWLAPPWDPSPAPEGRIRIDYQAGMACGSGAHPCTQLCLEALEEFVRPGCSVFDVGVGSGILSHAARRLGAGLVAGCDIEHADAAAAAQLAGNVFTGSLRAVRSGYFDLVVANINAATIRQLASELARIRKPGGRLIVSGFHEHELPPEWETSWKRTKDGWCCAA